MSATVEKKICGYTRSDDPRIHCTLDAHDGPEHSKYGAPFLTEGWGEPDERDSEPEIPEAEDSQRGLIEAAVVAVESDKPEWLRELDGDEPSPEWNVEIDEICEVLACPNGTGNALLALRKALADLAEARSQIDGATKLAAEKSALASAMQAAASDAARSRDNAAGDREELVTKIEMLEDVRRDMGQEIERLRGLVRSAATSSPPGGVVRRMKRKLGLVRKVMIAARAALAEAERS